MPLILVSYQGDGERRTVGTDNLYLSLSRDGHFSLTRRRLLGAGAAGIAAALAPIDWPDWLLTAARAATTDLVTDAINGLVAFIVPGRDPYSVAQGEVADEPGGIGAGSTPAVIAVLDFYDSDAEGKPIALSGLLATLLNTMADKVNPHATRGGFPSPFARLSFDEKRQAYHLIETDPALASEQGQLAILPAIVAFVTYSEAPVLDRATGRLTRRPVGWKMSGYGGPDEGAPELRGYYRGRRKAGV